MQSAAVWCRRRCCCGCCALSVNCEENASLAVRRPLPIHAARGMLRLEPSTAAEYARWVLALNAAFLASGAGAGVEAGGSSSSSDNSSGRGGDCRLQPVSSHRWSPAILFG